MLFLRKNEKELINHLFKSILNTETYNEKKLIEVLLKNEL